LPALAGKDIKKAIQHYAAAEYRNALKEDRNEPYWHLALAMALKGKGDRQGILDDYEVARKLAPDDQVLRDSYESLLGQAPEPGGAHGELLGAIDYKGGSGVSPPSPYYSPDPPYTEKARDAR
jgi:hypothetical protein